MNSIFQLFSSLTGFLTAVMPRSLSNFKVGAFLRTAGSGVHVVHTSHVIIDCILQKLSFPHIDNTQSAGHNQLLEQIYKKNIKKGTQAYEGTH